MSSKTLLLLTAAILFRGCSAGTDFAECAKIFTQENSTNSSGLVDSQGNSVFFNGPLVGFNKSPDRPVTITKQACIDYCGTAPDYNTVVAAFQVLTTWVLPVLGLMGQLPYESLSRKKWSTNSEAFANWIGAPAAALTTTLWNIFTIGQCQRRPSSWADENPDIIKDALYVLSCINQYEYPRRPPSRSSQPNFSYMRRDQALLWGIMFPYIESPHINDLQRSKLEDITKLLAFHLRLQRRRGVYPIYIGVLWFGVAFGLSIALAFANLGDNSTAHSLALGLLLCWVPIVVFASVVDRNPTSATHCSLIIKRWLFNVYAIIDNSTTPNEGSLWRAPRTEQDSRERSTATEQLYPFEIGKFLGQGRKLRYCGVTDTVLQRITKYAAPNGQLPLPQLVSDLEPGNLRILARTSDVELLSDAQRTPRISFVEFSDFQKELKTRPWKWYLVWIASQLIVMTCFGMTFMVSFNTPTVGFGCRSMLYLVWYVCTIPASILLLFKQEPGKLSRIFVMFFSALAVMALFTIMLVQTMNGFNNCTCKASIFGLVGSGGYVDFENAAFYSEHYNVRRWWGTATAIGGGMLVSSLSFLAWRWQKSSGLWKVNEERTVVVHDNILLDFII